GAPTRVTIRLALDDSTVVLTVRDNGRGFDVEAERQGGQGLANMADRARRMGGRLEIVSQPGAGARVRLVIPLLTDARPRRRRPQRRRARSSPSQPPVIPSAPM